MSTEAKNFIDVMEKLYANKGIRSIVKNATTKLGREKAAWYLDELAGVYRVGSYEHELIFTLAVCYMLSDKHHTTGNFGDSCRMASLLSGTDGQLNESFSRLFQNLLSSGKSSIFIKISKIVRRIHSKDVAINYYSLYDDLIRFKTDAHSVKFGWMFNYKNKKEA